MAWLALFPGRLLERTGNGAPRGMTVHDRTRLIGQLLHFFLDRYVDGIVAAFRTSKQLLQSHIPNLAGKTEVRHHLA